MAKQKDKALVDQETIDGCLAAAVAEGDLVNFRFLFLPYSPLRQDSTEDIQTAKYAYLLPAETSTPAYQEALACASSAAVRAHVGRELEKKGPAQLPWELLLRLADNAVRLAKYTTAAQAYELLRIRRRMQDVFYAHAEAALAAQDIPKAVRGFRIAVGLEYDYMAFPEPLPYVPNYQERALLLHAEYPRSPEDCVALQAPEKQLKTALDYLLLRPQAAARLEGQSLSVQVAFVEEFIRQTDAAWELFQQRYEEACALVDRLGRKSEGDFKEEAIKEEGLEEEIEAQQDQDFDAVMACLLGRSIEEGAWWQYLKELAYEHPAAALFLSRQLTPGGAEIIMPRYRKDAPLNGCLSVAAG